MAEDFEILCKHVEYSLILSQHEITAADLDRVDDLIFQVRHDGIERYDGANGDGTQDRTEPPKTWITINSHYMTHAKEFIQSFGVPRNTWVFVFESECFEPISSILCASS